MGGLSVNPKPRALLSVTDKSGLKELAAGLIAHGFELVASGGTAAFLRDSGFEAMEVSDLTGYPAIFGGRVKTLHPAIAGGILGTNEAAFAEVQELDLQPIDVVVVNLYNFEDARASGGAPDQIVEAIDIGGPTLLRAGAKNHQRVTVLCHPGQYPEFLAELDQHQGQTTPEFRSRMAGSVFALTHRYDAAISRWFAESSAETATQGIPLRYGENPHQQARLSFSAEEPNGPGLETVGLLQHWGKELSYNNIVDLVAALKLVGDFNESACAVIKHTNPCGLGLGPAEQALELALICDPVSAFGGVFAFNVPIDLPTAEVLAGRFLEIVAAPGFAPEALERLKKKKNVRVMQVDLPKLLAATRSRVRSWGVLNLEQDEDEGFPELDSWRVVAGDQPDPSLKSALAMAWKVCKHGKSNAIVIGRPDHTVGMGFGQMSRVDSVALAVMKARDQGLDLRGTVAASDGFFPFPDGILKLAEAGVVAVVAPGGSIRDDVVAQAAAEAGVNLILTDRRHFNH